MCIDSFHFPSFSFLRHFYHQDAKYDMFLSPKINKYSTRLIFVCLYFAVVMSLSYLLRRFTAMNNVRQWNVTLNMYQSDEVFLCCRHSYLRLFLFYVHRFIHFPSISFLRHFYHQDTKYDMFLSPKVNNFLHTTNFRLSLFSSGWNLIHSSEESFGGVWGWVRFLSQNKLQHILSELR